MKKITILILFITLNIYSQAESNSTLSTDNGKNVNVSETNTATSISENISERILTTSVIIGEVVILFLLLFYWKKTRNESKVNSVSTFKRNIQAIRDERIKPQVNSDLSTKRKSLQKHKNLESLDGKSITTRAKKMSISKGELFLAARINQLQSIYNER